MNQPDDAVPVAVAQLAELGVMTASLLHELRQPLFAMKAAAQLGLTGDAAAQTAALQRIVSQLEHAEDLVQHYGGLYGSRQAQTFALHEVIREAAQMLAHRRRVVGAELELALRSEEILLHGRPGALRQVVVNLLHNALDAVAGQESARRVTVSTRVEGTLACVAVDDSGPGLGPEAKARLFEPFFTTKAEGTGLGLYITRDLVQAEGGELVVAPRSAGGTRFEVRLRLER